LAISIAQLQSVVGSPLDSVLQGELFLELKLERVDALDPADPNVGYASKSGAVELTVGPDGVVYQVTLYNSDDFGRFDSSTLSYS